MCWVFTRTAIYSYNIQHPDGRLLLPVKPVSCSMCWVKLALQFTPTVATLWLHNSSSGDPSFVCMYWISLALQLVDVICSYAFSTFDTSSNQKECIAIDCGQAEAMPQTCPKRHCRTRETQQYINGKSSHIIFL